MRQAGHSQKRMLTMRLHMNRHMLFALFCVVAPTHTHTHDHSHTSVRYTHLAHTCRDTVQPSPRASLRSFLTSRDPKVNQLFFDWFDLVLTVCISAYAAAVRSCNGLPVSPCSPPSPWVPRFLCLHVPPLFCSCADQMADTLMGPVLSNGAELEFDTVTLPISAAHHQEPHRMLSGKCLYCLLEFPWWVWVSGYRRTWSVYSNWFEVYHVWISEFY